MSSGSYFPERTRFVKSGHSEPNLEKAPRIRGAANTDARRDYEQIVGAGIKLPVAGLPQSSPRPSPAPEAATAAPSSSSPRLSRLPTLAKLMKHAEQNDWVIIAEALKLDSNLINSVDQFGWTLLMVAACAGALKVTEVLLLAGANSKLVDKAGYSCRSLARKRGHREIVDLIERFCPPTEEQSEPAEEKTTRPVKRKLCAACNLSIVESHQKSHLTSTVHQLSDCRRGSRTHYCIPGSNRGFQLMLKSGWDGEAGLGPSGTGVKLPPKTTLKRDRKGLGASKGTARVTHFHSNDHRAVAAIPLKINQNKIELNQQIRREKLVERALRRELS